jgi:hypothetical protein
MIRELLRDSQGKNREEDAFVVLEHVSVQAIGLSDPEVKELGSIFLH